MANDEKRIYLRVNVQSHQEDHDGYCSGAEIDIDDRQVTILMTLNFFEDYEDFITYQLKTERWGCTGESGYCETGPSTTSVTKIKEITEQEFTVLDQLPCVGVPRFLPQEAFDLFGLRGCEWKVIFND